MPGWIGFPELLVLLLVILLVFGPKRLPEMGKSLGKGMREFKNSITGKEDESKPAELTAATAVTTTPPAAPDTSAVDAARAEHEAAAARLKAAEDRLRAAETRAGQS
jgi:sec-independent protein translocase protein TatA